MGQRNLLQREGWGVLFSTGKVHHFAESEAGVDFPVTRCGLVIRTDVFPLASTGLETDFCKRCSGAPRDARND